MKHLVSLVSFLVAACIAQSGAPPRQQAHVFDATISYPVHLLYLLFLPATYATTPDTHWPLILYLHGGSLRGEDMEQLRTLGLPHKLESEPDFPFVVVSPQCPVGEIWTDTEAIDALLDRVIRDYRIDQQRIYVTGHSMGGRGALYFAYKLPSRFAAVLALSPYSPITAWGSKLAQIPLWLFQGTADTFAPITETKELVGAIQSAGGHPLFNSLEGRDHFILDVYDRPDVYQWLLHQKRTTPAAAVPTPKG
jgi:predicted peptidase